MSNETPNIEKVKIIRIQTTRMIGNHPNTLQKMLKITQNFERFPKDRENYIKEMRKLIKELTDDINGIVSLLNDV